MILLLAAPLAACDDEFGPVDWGAAPDTVELWSIDRADSSFIGLPSAFDFVGLRAVVVESPGEAGNWDAVVTDTTDGLALAPKDALVDGASRAGIAVIDGVAFADLASAPGDAAAYEDSAAVPLTVGDVLVVRTRRFFDGLSDCHRYAKLHVIEVDASEGTVRFEYVRNPNCNDRALVPPGEDG